MATRRGLGWQGAAVALALAFGGACATTEPAAAPTQGAEPGASAAVPDAPDAPDAPRRGVKPHYVKCDPDHPEMPCTPDGPFQPPEQPAGDAPRPGVKPHYVKCDPDHPEMPCTPDALPRPEE